LTTWLAGPPEERRAGPPERWRAGVQIFFFHIFRDQIFSFAPTISPPHYITTFINIHENNGSGKEQAHSNL